MLVLKKKNIFIYGLGVFIGRAQFMGINPFAIAYFTVINAMGYEGLDSMGTKKDQKPPNAIYIILSIFIGFISTTLGSGKHLGGLSLLMGSKYLLAMIITRGVMGVSIVKDRKHPKGILFALPLINMGIVYIFYGLYSGRGIKGVDIALNILELLISAIAIYIFHRGINLLYSKDKHNAETEDVISLVLMTIVAAYGAPLLPGTAFAPIEIVIYSIIFILLFRDVMQIIGDDSINKQELNVTQDIKRLINDKMSSYSSSFLKLSKSIDSSMDPEGYEKESEINEIFEELSEKLCKTCRNCSCCWEDSFDATYEAANHMFNFARDNGVITLKDVPKGFTRSCINVESFLQEVNKGFEVAKINRMWHRRMEESKTIISGQLKEVSEAMDEFSKDIFKDIKRVYKAEKDIIKKLKNKNVTVKDLYVLEDINKRVKIYLEAYCPRGYCVTTKEVGKILTDIMGVSMRNSETSRHVISGKKDVFLFVEEPTYKMLSGIARTIKDTVSGDNFAVKEYETGSMLLLLSDGMGTGERASRESERVIALLEEFLEAGIKEEKAIKLINSALVLKAQEQMLTTIDMGVIDLHTGLGKFVKIGAATTFIRSRKGVEVINVKTMPIGMLSKVDYDFVERKLYEKDMVIMITDGILDAVKGEDKEEVIKNIIKNTNSDNPQEVANEILEMALRECNYEPIDDMTIITAGLWKR